MVERVIDIFAVVQVEVQDCEVGIVALRTCDSSFNSLDEHLAVYESRQIIITCHSRDLLVGGF